MDRTQLIVTAALAGIMAAGPVLAKDAKKDKKKASATTEQKAPEVHCGGADHCAGKAGAKGEMKCSADACPGHDHKAEGTKAEDAKGPAKQ